MNAQFNFWIIVCFIYQIKNFKLQIYIHISQIETTIDGFHLIE